MAFPYTLPADELRTYQEAISRSLEVRSHFDVMVWLQGDMQRYIPHDVMISAWGNFESGNVQHDVVSALDGVRSTNSDAAVLTPFLVGLFQRWAKLEKRPYTVRPEIGGFLGDINGVHCAVGQAVQNMRSAIVHGIHDKRGSHASIYVAFSQEHVFDDSQRTAFSLAVPYIDNALRQVDHLPHQTFVRTQQPTLEEELTTDHNLSSREVEVLHWVALGKTNPEIGTILGISEFTVKNHLQRLFKKLDVTNRAQAVARLRALGMHKPRPQVSSGNAPATGFKGSPDARAAA